MIEIYRNPPTWTTNGSLFTESTSTGKLFITFPACILAFCWMKSCTIWSSKAFDNGSTAGWEKEQEKTLREQHLSYTFVGLCMALTCWWFQSMTLTSSQDGMTHCKKTQSFSLALSTNLSKTLKRNPIPPVAPVESQVLACSPCR